MQDGADREGVAHTTKAIITADDETDGLGTATFQFTTDDRRDFEVTRLAWLPAVDSSLECACRERAQ